MTVEAPSSKDSNIKRVDMMTVLVCYFRGSAELYGEGLAYATAGAVGLDLRACFEQSNAVIAPGERLAVPSGLAIEAQAKDMAGFVYSRSGLGAVKGLTVAQGVGVIDQDYRGEIIVYLLNTSQTVIEINRGDRVAQLIFQPVARLEPQTVDSLTDTERGAGGFGHTGKK